VAGCRTALTLADHGVKVLLLDRAEFPRWKPCAGGLTPKTRPYLPEPLFDLVERTIHGAYLTFGDDLVTHIQSEAPLGWMVHRESFDKRHLDLARSRPTVEVVEGVTVRKVREHDGGVEVETTHGTLKASVLVGADGAKSVVSRALPGHESRTLCFAYEGEVRPGPGAAGARPDFRQETLFDFRTFPSGYGWVFPKADHSSIGGFVYRNKLPGIKEAYDGFCSSTEWIRGSETYRSQGHPTALGGDGRFLASSRILLAGEAGNLVDPLTGEGIYYALRSGHLAGEAAFRFLEKGEPLSVYGNQVRHEIQDDLRYAKTLARLIYNRPGLAFHLLLRNRLLCRWFAEVGAGTRTYKTLFRDALRQGFILPFHARLRGRVEVEVEIPTLEA